MKLTVSAVIVFVSLISLAMAGEPPKRPDWALINAWMGILDAPRSTACSAPAEGQASINQAPAK